MSENKKPPENPPEKDEDDKLKFQEYIVSLFMDFAEKNKIDPMVCYEIAHELELSWPKIAGQKVSMTQT